MPKNHLHDLCVCARQILHQLTPDGMTAVAAAIKWAESEIERLNKEEAPPTTVVEDGPQG